MVPRFGQELGVVAEEDLDALPGSARALWGVDAGGRPERDAGLPQVVIALRQLKGVLVERKNRLTRSRNMRTSTGGIGTGRVALAARPFRECKSASPPDGRADPIDTQTRRHADTQTDRTARTDTRRTGAPQRTATDPDSIGLSVADASHLLWISRPVELVQTYSAAASSSQSVR
jgi:hypothetical protein